MSVRVSRRGSRNSRAADELHRNHAYQYAAVRRGAQMPAAVVVGLISVGWLLPVAVVTAVRLKARRRSTS